jgi:pyruvate kinase
VVAACSRVCVRRQLALEWGVVPVDIEPVKTIEQMSHEILERIRERRLAAPGDVVVMTGKAHLEALAKANHVLVLRMTGG